MLRHRIRFTAVRIVTAVAVFVTQTGLAQAADSSVWSERRVKATAPNEPVQLAALPSLFTPATSSFSSVAQTPVHLFSDDLQKELTHRGISLPLDVLRPLSEGHGSIRNVVMAAPHSATPARTLIYLQDVHMNREVQDNIRTTVEALFKDGGVDLLALEGAFDSVDTSVYRNFSKPQWVKATADYLYRENKISGAVRAAMTATGTVPPVQGIDDKTLYDANVQAFRGAYAERAAIKEELNRFERENTAKKTAAFSPALGQFDAMATAYHKGTISFGAYARLLSQDNPTVSDNMRTFLQALSLEKSLDMGNVERERTAAITRLGEKMSPAEIRSLVDHATAYRLEHLSHAEFYSYIRSLCSSKNISLSSYPSLDGYIRYVLLSEKIRIEPLMEETERLENVRYDSLARTSVEKNLIADSREAVLVGKLLNFSLTAKEWEEYKAGIPPHVSQWGGKEGNKLTFLIATPQRLAPPSLPIGKHGEELGSFEAFYLAAEARDRAMTEKLLSAMDKTNARVAVLVTGGFHTTGVTEALAKRGVTSVVFVPKVTKVENEDGVGYLSVFAQEKTPLDRLFDGEKLFVPPHVAAPEEIAEGFIAGYGAATEGENVARAVVPELTNLPNDVGIAGGNGAATVTTANNVLHEDVDGAGEILGSSVEGRRNIIKVIGAIAAGLWNGVGEAQQAKKKAQRPAAKGNATKATTKRAAPARTLVSKEVTDRFAAHIAGMKRGAFFLSNGSSNNAFLYDVAFLVHTLPDQVGAALLLQIYHDWPGRRDVFLDERGTRPTDVKGLTITGADADTGAEGESLVDTGTIFHIGISALNLYYRTGRRNSRLLLIAKEAVNYGMKMTAANGLVRHGPLSGKNDPKDQHFGFNADAAQLYDTFTFEHQHEFRHLLEGLAPLPGFQAERATYMKTAEKNRVAALKLFWDANAKRFRGAYETKNGDLRNGRLTQTFPTDQIQLVSMEGVDNLLNPNRTGHMSLQDLKNFFAAIDKEHSVRNDQGDIVGYGFLPHQSLISVEWSAQAVAAKLQFALYLKSRPELKTPWQDYAVSAIRTARYLARLQPGDTGGLAYAYDADGKPAYGVPTGYITTPQGEALISSAYLLSVLLGIDPVAHLGGRMDVTSLLAQIPEEAIDISQNAVPANDKPAPVLGDNILASGNPSRYDGSNEGGGYAMVWDFPKHPALPAGPLTVRFTAKQSGNVVLELVRVKDNNDDPPVWQPFEAVQGVNEFTTDPIPAGMRVKRMTLQIGNIFSKSRELGVNLNAQAMSPLTKVSITASRGNVATKKAQPKAKATPKRGRRGSLRTGLLATIALAGIGIFGFISWFHSTQEKPARATSGQNQSAPHKAEEKVPVLKAQAKISAPAQQKTAARIVPLLAKLSARTKAKQKVAPANRRLVVDYKFNGESGELRDAVFPTSITRFLRNDERSAPAFALLRNSAIVELTVSNPQGVSLEASEGFLIAVGIKGDFHSRSIAIIPTGRDDEWIAVDAYTKAILPDVSVTYRSRRTIPTASAIPESVVVTFNNGFSLLAGQSIEYLSVETGSSVYEVRSAFHLRAQGGPLAPAFLPDVVVAGYKPTGTENKINPAVSAEDQERQARETFEKTPDALISSHPGHYEGHGTDEGAASVFYDFDRSEAERGYVQVRFAGEGPRRMVIQVLEPGQKPDFIPGNLQVIPVRDGIQYIPIMFPPSGGRLAFHIGQHVGMGPQGTQVLLGKGQIRIMKAVRASDLNGTPNQTPARSTPKKSRPRGGLRSVPISTLVKGAGFVAMAGFVGSLLSSSALASEPASRVAAKAVAAAQNAPPALSTTFYFVAILLVVVVLVGVVVLDLFKNNRTARRGMVALGSKVLSLASIKSRNDLAQGKAPSSEVADKGREEMERLGIKPVSGGSPEAHDEFTARDHGDRLADYLLSASVDTTQHALQKAIEALPSPIVLGVGEVHWGVIPQATAHETEKAITAKLAGTSHSVNWSDWSRPFYVAQQALANHAMSVDGISARSPEIGNRDGYYLIDAKKSAEQVETELRGIAANLKSAGQTLYVGGDAASLETYGNLLNSIRAERTSLHVQSITVENLNGNEGPEIISALEALRSLPAANGRRAIDNVLLLADLNSAYHTTEASNADVYNQWMALYGSIPAMNIEDFINNNLSVVTTVGVVTQLEGFIRAAINA